jgi:hypothetical protein
VLLELFNEPYQLGGGLATAYHFYDLLVHGIFQTLSEEFYNDLTALLLLFNEILVHFLGLAEEGLKTGLHF